MGENVFAEIGCVGTKYCDATGMCAKECTTEAAPVRAACETSTDCADGEYCGRNGGCLSSGFCETLSDCFMPGHDLVFPACVGTVLCETGMCTKNCDGGKPLPEPLPAAGGNPGVIGGNGLSPRTQRLSISVFFAPPTTIATARATSPPPLPDRPFREMKCTVPRVPANTRGTAPRTMIASIHPTFISTTSDALATCSVPNKEHAIANAPPPARTDRSWPSVLRTLAIPTIGPPVRVLTRAS